MIEKIISFSVNNKLITGIILCLFVCWGMYSITQLSIDVMPDVTNNQVQCITVSPNLATQEVEQFITYPLEMEFKNLPDLVELRSTSRSGLSIITVVFDDHVPIYLARQQVAERMKSAEEHIPKEFGAPELNPPTTGLGEIYQYTLAVDTAHKVQYTPMDLRTIQDWIVRRQLLGVPGVVDVSSFGGFLKQYEIAVHPEKLIAMNISLLEVYDALERNNENTGGTYIEKGPNIYFIRGEGLVESFKDIENIVVKTEKGVPIRIHDLAKVQFGSAPRYGAMTRNGEGEAVGGVVLMMKGANSVAVIEDVKARMEQIQKSLPEGVTIDVFVDRTKLIHQTISTVEENLLMGALIVLFILILFLGNFRAGLIVASVIPLSLLFAIAMMNVFGVSANLMSMGALDFGLIVDGAVIIVESIMFVLHSRYVNAQLTGDEMDKEIISNSSQIMRSAIFGQVIILIVYIPIFALTGIEGKMFRPMAQTVSFSVIGALLLSLTYVPLMSSLFLSRKITSSLSFSERMMVKLQSWYIPLLRSILKWRITVILIFVILLGGTIFLFSKLGGEFIPELDEGDFAINYTIRQGSNLSQTIEVGTQLEKILLDNIPEVKEAVSKIGTSEIPSDPMPLESADLIAVMKDKKEWTSAKSKEEMAELMNEKMKVIPGVNLSFEQPIQMRFNELIAGVKSDIAVKIFGENLDVLFSKANEAAALVAKVPGAVDIKVEQIVGMPQLVVKYNRERIAQYGLNIHDINQVLNAALAGGKAGTVYEGERKFDLVVRLANYRDADIDKVRNIYVPVPNGSQIPIGLLADVSFQSAPAEISRDNGERRIVIETNIRGRDIQSVANEISATLIENLKLPPGYYIEYGGTFQNLQKAKARLMIVVPAALLFIFILLFLAFRSFKETIIIFSAIPLAAIGGVLAIWLRGMNFSISAGVGFIALFGVAVLNGIVLISYFNRLEKEGEMDVSQRILKGTAARLRPVLVTAAVASLGFLPMALSTSAGSEVQKPLATVVIGGLISSTLLTLVVLPVLYSLFFKTKLNMKSTRTIMPLVVAFLSFTIPTYSQGENFSLDSCIQLALINHPHIRTGAYAIEQQEHLKRTNFTFEPLNVNYQGGEINSGVYDYTLNISTGIPFPTTTNARANFQNQKVELARRQLNITKNELIRNVSVAYYQLLFAQQRLKELNSLDSLCNNLVRFINRQYTLGESTQLQKISAEGKCQEIVWQQNFTQSEIDNYQAELRQWTGVNNEIMPDADELLLLNVNTPDSSSLASNPYLAWQQEQIKASMAEWKVEKTRNAPSIQFGYFIQSLDRITPFMGYTVGLTMPLIKSGQQGRIQSMELQTRIEEENLYALQRSLETDLEKAINKYNQFKSRLDYFMQDGLALAQAMMSTAEKSFQAGDIGYVEFIQNTSQAFQIRMDYWQAYLGLELTEVEINSLTAQ